MEKLTKAEVKVKLDLHLKWLRNEPGGVRANLDGANLTGANLNGANLDFSSWPLWCGTKGAKVDLKFVFQLLAHVAVLDCKEEKFESIKKVILPYAKESHRAQDLGL